MSPNDAKLLTLMEMAKNDWHDAHPKLNDPIMVAVFAAGYDAGAAAIIQLISTRKWDPHAH